MKRSVLAFIAGLIAWIVVVSLVDRVLRLALAGYAAAEPTLTFTPAMMAARLGMAALTSLTAGAVIGAIARDSKRTPWILGAVLLAIFIPTHVKLWSSLPLWYHLTFLVPLAPLIALGTWLTRQWSTRGQREQPVAD